MEPLKKLTCPHRYWLAGLLFIGLLLGLTALRYAGEEQPAPLTAILQQLSPALRQMQDMVAPPAYASSPARPLAQTGDVCFAQPVSSGVVYSSTTALAVQQAVDAATEGDTVKVAGTCAGVQAWNGTNQTLYITKSLTVQGGYTTTNWNTSFPLTQPTTLDAQSSGRVVSATTAITLSNLTIQNGSIAGDGGGVYATGALILDNVTVFSNTAACSGGGVHAAGAATFLGGRFEANNSDSPGGGEGSGSGSSEEEEVSCLYAGGGGLYVSGTLALTGTQFISNTSGNNGGGLYAASTLTLTDTQFFSNTAACSGGGVHAAGAATFLGGRFENNNAYGLGEGSGSGEEEEEEDSCLYAGGGGLYAGGALALTGTQFISNIATSAGGGAYAAGAAMLSDGRFEHNTSSLNGGGLATAGALTLTVTQFISNTAASNGGGLYIKSDGDLNTVTLTGNNANTGGGLYVYSGMLNQSGGVVTLTHNSAATYGGGAYLNGGSLTLTNARLLTNTAGNGGAVYQAGGATNISHSCIVFNSDTAVNHAGGTNPLLATINWWGTADGPSGAGPGFSDSVSNYVDFSGFLTSNSLGCPNWFPATVTLSKSASPQTIPPHDPVTYTVSLHNNSLIDARLVQLTDSLPLEVNFARWITRPAEARQNDNVITWTGRITAGHTITLSFVVTATGTTGGPVTNVVTATYVGADYTAQADFSAAAPALGQSYLPLVVKDH